MVNILRSKQPILTHYLFAPFGLDAPLGALRRGLCAGGFAPFGRGIATPKPVEGFAFERGTARSRKNGRPNPNRSESNVDFTYQKLKY